MTNPIGVLIMAYGGPNSLEEIPGYLADIRNGRCTTPAILKEITHNYPLIGGKSPLLAFSTLQVEAVRAQLDPDKFKVYLGMRHWSPWTYPGGRGTRRPRTVSVPTRNSPASGRASACASGRWETGGDNRLTAVPVITHARIDHMPNRLSQLRQLGSGGVDAGGITGPFRGGCDEFGVTMRSAL